MAGVVLAAIFGTAQAYQLDANVLSISSPPPAAGYFSLHPVGSWSSLPSDSQCAAAVTRSTWEPRPANQQQNNTMPASGAMAAAFSTRPRDQGGSYNSLWDTWLLPRVDGQFTGTTDEIFQWAACKWGLPDSLIRADAVVESTWFQYLHFTQDASFGGGGGSCYWNRGCGDAFSSPTTNSTTYCNGIATEGVLASQIHDYQKDPVTSVGGYPYTPTSGLCPKTFSILGVMSWDDPAWEAPFPPYAGNQNGTFPFTRDSTATAVDYWAAHLRGCYDGWESFLANTGTGTYAAGDLWGCVGDWYSGDWHSAAADSYIANVQTEENNLTWLTASFDDSTQQYQCDPTYGCPTAFRCTGVTISAAPPSPQTSGATVTFTAAASGCPHPLYQFWILAPGSTTWQVAQAYSAAATFTWITVGRPAGKYLYTVWVRDSGSNGTSCGSLGCEDAYVPGTAYTLN